MELPLIEPSTNPLRNRLMTAAPDLLIATVYLITWIAPRLFGDDTVQHLIFIIIFEFVILHSAAAFVALLGSKGAGKGIGSMIAISLLYLFFAVGFGFAIQAWWPVVAIIGLTVNRVQTLRHAPQAGRTAFTSVLVPWGLSFGFYFFLYVAVHVIPWPALGIDAAIVDALLSKGSGSLVEEPQIALAFGLLYYVGVGLAEGLGLFNKATDRINTMFSGW